MIRKYGFRRALAEGNRQYSQALERGDFERELFDPRGFARLIKIKDLRRSGILPMEAV